MLEVVFSNSAKGSMSCGLRNRIFCFELGLDVGRIAGRRFWAEREQELKHFSAAPHRRMIAYTLSTLPAVSAVPAQSLTAFSRRPHMRASAFGLAPQPTTPAARAGSPSG